MLVILVGTTSLGTSVCVRIFRILFPCVNLFSNLSQLCSKVGPICGFVRYILSVLSVKKKLSMLALVYYICWNQGTKWGGGQGSKITGLSLACPRHISGISQLYLRHIPAIFQAYPSYISGKYKIYFRPISDLYLVLFLVHISGLSNAFLRYHVIQANLWYISDISQLFHSPIAPISHLFKKKQISIFM